MSALLRLAPAAMNALELVSRDETDSPEADRHHCFRLWLVMPEKAFAM
jgi:hypothetical protein